MASNQESLRWILYSRRLGKDSEGWEILRQEQVEVEPLGDDLLVSSDISPQEKGEVLEGRLRVVQAALESIGENCVKEQYGFELPVDGNTSRVVSYIELLDEYRVVSSSVTTQIEEIEGRYEEGKALLRDSWKRKEMSEGKYRHLVRNKRLKCEDQMSPLADRRREVGRMKNLVLGKAVIDLFSVDEEGKASDLLRQFPQILDELNRNLVQQSEGGVAENFSRRKPVDYFADELSRYFLTTEDSSKFHGYRYKGSTRPVSTLEDCQILGSLLRMRLDTESCSNNPETQRQLTDLSSGCLQFLIHRARYLSSGISDEKLPILSLIYDLSTVVAVDGRGYFIERAIEYIDQQFDGLTSSHQVRSEVCSLAKSQAECMGDVYGEFGKYESKFLYDGRDISSLAEESLDTIAGIYKRDEFRIAGGFVTINRIVRKHSDVSPWGKFRTPGKVMEYFGEPYKRGMRGVNDRYGQFTQKEMNRILKTLGPDGDIFTGIISIDLSTILHRSSPGLSGESYPYPELRSDKDYRNKFKILKRSYESCSRAFNERFDHRSMGDFIRDYTLLFWADSGKDKEQVDRENDFLWGQVLDDSMWFVSPRGDRYRSRDDYEQEAKGIESITFRIDKDEPRHHIVEVRLSEIPKPIYFWLDTNRALMLDRDFNRASGERVPIAIEPDEVSGITNMFLRRLHLITSGLLSKPTVRVGPPSEEARLLEYKRAHYRILRSTRKRRYHMESRSAEMHALEIMDEYGIDIFAEIRRRWKLGTLRPDEYMTFVRESILAEISKDMMPNELVYDSELIKIPI
jgi:hypothetical protein